MNLFYFTMTPAPKFAGLRHSPIRYADEGIRCQFNCGKRQGRVVSEIKSVDLASSGQFNLNRGLKKQPKASLHIIRPGLHQLFSDLRYPALAPVFQHATLDPLVVGT